MSLIPEIRSAFALLDQPLLRTSLRHQPLYSSLLAQTHRQPALDIREEPSTEGTAGRYVVEAEFPGAKKEDVSVEFTDGGSTLVVSGKVERFSSTSEPSRIEHISTPTPADAESAATAATESAVARKEDNEVTEPTWHATERSFGSFTRSVRFPVVVDYEAAKASYTDGVLRVEVPKKSVEMRQKVEVQ